jgi:WD40 repeat protein
VNQIDYAPDGRFVAVASSLGIILQSAQTWGEISTVRTKTSVTSIVFSPNGHMLAAGMEDNTLTLWQLVDIQPPDALEDHKHSGTIVDVQLIGVLSGFALAVAAFVAH